MGKYLRSQEVGDWDRGFHVLVGEEEVRGRERVRVWLSALVHWCWVVEGRTGRVVCEPRVDGVRYVFFSFGFRFFLGSRCGGTGVMSKGGKGSALTVTVLQVYRILAGGGLLQGEGDCVSVQAGCADDD